MTIARNCLMVLLGALLLGSIGCKKAPTTPAAPSVGGVTVDLPKLRDAFPNPGPEAQKALTDVQFGIRYGQFVQALKALDELVNSPNLSDPQKKVVNEVIEQIKQVINKQPALTQ